MFEINLFHFRVDSQKRSDGVPVVCMDVAGEIQTVLLQRKTAAVFLRMRGECVLDRLCMVKGKAAALSQFHPDGLIEVVFRTADDQLKAGVQKIDLGMDHLGCRI